MGGKVTQFSRILPRTPVKIVVEPGCLAAEAVSVPGILEAVTGLPVSRLRKTASRPVRPGWLAVLFFALSVPAGGGGLLSVRRFVRAWAADGVRLLASGRLRPGTLVRKSLGISPIVLLVLRIFVPRSRVGRLLVACLFAGRCARRSGKAVCLIPVVHENRRNDLLASTYVYSGPETDSLGRGAYRPPART